MCIFMGEVSINLLNNDNLTDLYLNSLLGAGLEQCVDIPTRVTENTISCIDHVFVRNYNMITVHASILQTGLTDRSLLNYPHYQWRRTHSRTHTDLYYGLSTGLYRPSCRYRLTRYTDWGSILNSYDVDVSFERFYNLIKNAIKCIKTIVTKLTRHKKINPWITESLVRSIRARDKLSKRVKPFIIIVKNYYRAYRQNLRSLIRKS